MTKETFTPKSGTNPDTDSAPGMGTAASRAARRASGNAGSGARVNPQTGRARQAPRSRRGRQISSARARRRTMLLFVGIPIVFVVVFIGVLLAVSNGPSGVGLVNANDLNPGPSPLSVVHQGAGLYPENGRRKELYTLLLQGQAGVASSSSRCGALTAKQNQKCLTNWTRHSSRMVLQTIAVLASPYGKNYDNSGGTDLTIATKSDINWFISTFKVKHLTLIDPTFATVNKYGEAAIRPSTFWIRTGSFALPTPENNPTTPWRRLSRPR